MKNSIMLQICHRTKQKSVFCLRTSNFFFQNCKVFKRETKKKLNVSEYPVCFQNSVVFRPLTISVTWHYPFTVIEIKLCPSLDIDWCCN